MTSGSTSVLEYVHQAGLDENESFKAGDLKMHYSIGEKEGTSYTIRYDHRDEKIVKIGVVPGLTGKELSPKDLQKCAVWLQAPSHIDLYVNDNIVDDMRGKLLGKEVGGKELIEKVGDFFGALKERNLNKAMSLAVEAAKVAKAILPSISRMPFASNLTGRTRAFAMAATKVIKSTVAPEPMALANAPSFGMGSGMGGSTAQKGISKKVKKEEDKEDA